MTCTSGSARRIAGREGAVSTQSRKEIAIHAVAISAAPCIIKHNGIARRRSSERDLMQTGIDVNCRIRVGGRKNFEHAGTRQSAMRPRVVSATPTPSPNKNGRAASLVAA